MISVEYAEGVSPMYLAHDYAIIDSYLAPRSFTNHRLLLVSRVTKLNDR
ncbi:hypothetical protein O9992_14545 [Vibrio lentus]|nr:hypothetical protein [Vibrio lentus]